MVEVSHGDLRGMGTWPWATRPGERSPVQKRTDPRFRLVGCAASYRMTRGHGGAGTAAPGVFDGDAPARTEENVTCEKCSQS
jgi:hypothetical protein